MRQEVMIMSKASMRSGFFKKKEEVKKSGLFISASAQGLQRTAFSRAGRVTTLTV
jgi:hypothetical protein